MKPNNKKIIAIIPARGGSKTVPKKNIKLLAGKPLIAYTIEEAKKSKYLDRIIVSTQDKEIANVSEKYGAEVIKRPEHLAGDTSKTIDALLHVVRVLIRKKYFPEIAVELQPTSPLRQVKDIDEAIEFFFKNKSDSVTVASVCEEVFNPYLALKIEKKSLKPVFGWEYFSKRKQDLPKVYFPNGAIHIFTPKFLFKNKSVYRQKVLPYIMPSERSIDIDQESDFLLAETYLNKL
ncbi:MAG: acylneuraminate cytidylyltransferase [Parcubacteria group bacterium]|nr:acylneuraminate cytidylyltransferase [Parcubacteria group bacterium]